MPKLNSKITDKTGCVYAYNLTRNLLNKHLTWDKCIIEDYDLDRIYLTVDEEDYTIRTWDIRQINKDTLSISYTLFHLPKELNCGVEKASGSCTTKFN